MKLLYLVFFAFILTLGSVSATPFSVSSPDHHLSVEITAGKTLTYVVRWQGKYISGPNQVSIQLSNGITMGDDAVVIDSRSTHVNDNVHPLYGMSAVYHNQYNQLTIRFRQHYTITFRVFNNGVAYRFASAFDGTIKVQNEQAEFRFADNAQASMMKVNDFLNSYEEHYIDDRISYLDSGKIAALPLLVKSGGINVGITEADLLDYAGMYLTYDGNHILKAVFPNYVLKDSVGGCCPNFEKLPTARGNFIAETNGNREYPWRLLIISENDKDLLYNNLVYLLASERKLKDVSWIKPGKVAWDWWNANTLTGVSFKSGINTATYKYFIDFAARNGIQYINLDEGWSDQYDLLKPNAKTRDLDMDLVFNYAKKKGVGIILWCVWHTLDRQMQQALDQFQKWGVAGIKVDFMDRDDQSVVNFYERLAREAAKRKMLVNFHGAFKPTGLERTYPNVINREAVQGLEYNKFSNKATPDHLAHIPFIRMLAGPMDYTPGGLTNANSADFRIIRDRPMTQGTRCQQLALYTLLYAPLQMLSDSPTAYEQEPAILNYITSVPTTWDETIPLDGKVGQFAVLARRSGSSWFVSGVTNNSSRTISLAFNFLPPGKYKAEIFKDGQNADRVGNDYERATQVISPGDTIPLTMSGGGGFAIKLIKE